MWIVIILIVVSIGFVCIHLHKNYQLQVSLATRNKQLLPIYPIKRISLLLGCGLLVLPFTMHFQRQIELSVDIQSERRTEIVIDFSAYPEYLQDANMVELFSIQVEKENYVGTIEIRGITYEFYFQEGMQIIKTNNQVYKVNK